MKDFDISHTSLQQLTEITKKAFASQSKNGDEKEKEKKKKN